MTVRCSEEAEESLLGAMLLAPAATRAGTEMCVAGDFYTPRNGHIFAAIESLYERGDPVDAVTVTDELRRMGTLESVGDPSLLVSLMNSTPSLSATRHYAQIVTGEASARQLQTLLGEGRNQLDEQVDAQVVVDFLEERVRSIDRGGKLPERYWRTASEFLAEDHTDTTEPLARGVLYPLSRVMVVATEKLGKSVLVRQIAFSLAAGMHPFDPRIPVEPVRVLIFDAENDDDELVASMDRIRTCIRTRCGDDAAEPAVYSVPYGVDLELRRDKSQLMEVVQDFRPQLIVGGPIYKLTDQTSDLSEDRRAGIVQGIFNDIRRRWGCAVMLEHHAPTGQKGQRDIRGKGGQVWPAWVNMTIALHSINEGASAEVRYPHPPRGIFRWPKQFDRGQHDHEFPWVPVLRHADDYKPPPPSSGDYVDQAAATARRLLPDSEPSPFDEEPF